MATDWEKTDLRVIWKVAKCGDGFHLWIPKSLVEALELESHDEIRVHLVEIRHARARR